MENDLLREPAALVAHRTALALLDEARDAAIVLVHAKDEDPDALHDFRVAVRRLRSWLQLWKSELTGTVSRRLRRDVRDIARETGPARDLQVHLDWLRVEHARVKARTRDDVERLIERFVDRGRSAMRDARGAAQELVALHVELSRRLGEYSVARHGSMLDQAPLGPALAAQLRAAADELRDQLRKVRRSSDHEAAHAARIAAKRMRYLLERDEETVRGAAGIVRDLKALQDLVGDANDAYVFSKELKAFCEEEGLRGWRTLDRRLRARGAAAYAKFKRAWLGSASDGFFRRVDRVVRRLDPARRG
jgi:CHAD domain-containing protein